MGDGAPARQPGRSAPTTTTTGRGPDSWRRLIAAAVGLVTLLAVFGLSQLKIDDDLRSLLRDSGDDVRLVDEVAGGFGAPDRECIVHVTAESGDLFDAPSIAAIRSLTGRLKALDGVEQVRSMFDIRRQGVAGAILPVIPQVEGELRVSDGQAARARAIDHPLIVGHLLADHGRSAIVLVRLQPDAVEPPALSQAVTRIETLLAAERAGPARLTLELTGLPALREQATRALRRDILFFNTIGFCLAVTLLAFVARSLRSTIVACIPPVIGAVWAMGIIAAMGFPLNVLTGVVPSLALVIGTCDSIHFIEDMRRSARRGVNAVTASRNAVRRVGVACGLTSLVTAIGFASLAAARIDAVRTFGMAAATGAVASFLAVTLVTPLLASTAALGGVRLGRSSRRVRRQASRLAHFALAHSRPVAVAGCVVTLLLALLSFRLDADFRVIDFLPHDADASRALARVEDDFGGAMGVDVVVRWPVGLGCLDDAVLDSLAAVHGVLEHSGGLPKAISLSTVVRTLPVRARRRLDPGKFPDLVDDASRTAIVSTRVGDLGSKALEAICGRIDAGLNELAATRPGWTFQLAGMSVGSARTMCQLIRDLGGSLVLEVIVIAGILSVVFRSPLVGIVSLIPNVFPLAVIAAILVASGRSLDPATVIVFNICLGLAVDDTVHLLAAIQRQRRDGVSMPNSIRRGVAETGNAIVLSGVMLAVGFAVLTLSSVPSLSCFGMLACVAVVAATVAELVFLPALLGATAARDATTAGKSAG